MTMRGSDSEMGPYAADWPTPRQTRAPIGFVGWGTRVRGCHICQIPAVIGAALDSQDLAMIDQVVVRVEPDGGGRGGTYTTSVVEFRGPSFPSTPYWFAQCLVGVLEAWQDTAPGELPGALYLCADRGGLFWLDHRSDSHIDSFEQAARERGWRPVFGV